MKTIIFVMSLLVLVSCGDKDKSSSSGGGWRYSRNGLSAPATQTGYLVLQNGTILVGNTSYQVQPIPNQVIINAINIAQQQNIPPVNGRYKARITAACASQYGTMYGQQTSNLACSVVSPTSVQIVR